MEILKQIGEKLKQVHQLIRDFGDFFDRYGVDLEECSFDMFLIDAGNFIVPNRTLQYVSNGTLNFQGVKTVGQLINYTKDYDDNLPCCVFYYDPISNGHSRLYRINRRFFASEDGEIVLDVADGNEESLIYLNGTWIKTVNSNGIMLTETELVEDIEYILDSSYHSKRATTLQYNGDDTVIVYSCIDYTNLVCECYEKDSHEFLWGIRTISDGDHLEIRFNDAKVRDECFMELLNMLSKLDAVSDRSIEHFIEVYSSERKSLIETIVQKILSYLVKYDSSDIDEPRFKCRRTGTKRSNQNKDIVYEVSIEEGNYTITGTVKQRRKSRRSEPYYVFHLKIDSSIGAHTIFTDKVSLILTSNNELRYIDGTDRINWVASDTGSDEQSIDYVFEQGKRYFRLGNGVLVMHMQSQEGATVYVIRFPRFEVSIAYRDGGLSTIYIDNVQEKEDILTLDYFYSSIVNFKDILSSTIERRGKGRARHGQSN